MDSLERIGELEQALLDERRERDAAQRRSATLSENVKLWRGRAEDRTARIKRLEEERDSLRGLGGWLKWVKRSGSSPTRRAEALSDESIGTSQITPSIPAVRCVAVVGSDDLLAGLNVFDTVGYGPSVSLLEADTVLVDEPGLRMLSAGETSSLGDFARLDVRPPFVVTGDVPSHLRALADVIIESDDVSGRFFDPRRWNPSIRTTDMDLLDDSESFTAVEGFGAVADREYDISSTRDLEIAASGTPFADISGDDKAVDRLGRLGVSHRRFAYERRHTELVRFARQLMVDLPGLRPQIAGLLVSNRPDDALRAIEQFGHQRYRPLELIVGCHGFSRAEIASALSTLPKDVPVTVREFNAGLSLGQCLNECMSKSGASVIAKIDDDDHYGPNYLVDAMHALEYSGASIIGKATSYTYIESSNRTVLRRPGYEETIYNGSPTGATLVWRRGVWERNPFPHRTMGEDYAFLRGARRLGFDVYVNSRFEFVYRRRRQGNTWRAPDDVFTEGSGVGWQGDHPENADVPATGPPFS